MRFHMNSIPPVILCPTRLPPNQISNKICVDVERLGCCNAGHGALRVELLPSPGSSFVLHPLKQIGMQVVDLLEISDFFLCSGAAEGRMHPSRPVFIEKRGRGGGNLSEEEVVGGAHPLSEIHEASFQNVRNPNHHYV